MAGRGRDNQGNMLVLSVCAGFFLVILIMIGFGIHSIMFSQQRGQTSADSAALSTSMLLNPEDRVGRMNFVVGRCRDLVFASREAHDETLRNYRHLEPLARQLLQEARDSATLLETERRRLLQQTLQEVAGKVKTGDAARDALTLPFVKTSTAEASYVDVGTMEAPASNVMASPGLDALIGWDAGHRYLNVENGYLFGNRNLRLPGNDGDLDFKISALPRPENGHVVPARLIPKKDFKQYARIVGEPSGACEYFPNAVRFGMKMNVEANQNKRQVEINATAAGAGANFSP